MEKEARQKNELVLKAAISQQEAAEEKLKYAEKKLSSAEVAVKGLQKAKGDLTKCKGDLTKAKEDLARARADAVIEEGKLSSSLAAKLDIEAELSALKLKYFELEAKGNQANSPSPEEASPAQGRKASSKGNPREKDKAENVKKDLVVVKEKKKAKGGRSKSVKVEKTNVKGRGEAQPQPEEEDADEDADADPSLSDESSQLSEEASQDEPVENSKAKNGKDRKRKLDQSFKADRKGPRNKKHKAQTQGIPQPMAPHGYPYPYPPPSYHHPTPYPPPGYYPLPQYHPPSYMYHH